MVSQTHEAALEAHIENALIGHGYRVGEPADFDRELAIDGRLFWQFLETTQPQELAKISHRPQWQRQLLERLNKKIRQDGVLAILKKGLDIDHAHFDLLYRLPASNLNPDAHARFAANRFSLTRQVRYSRADTARSIDMVLFVNGLAVATLELKNPWTGQHVHHAIRQYRTDRNPAEPLFGFGRCLVHLAVDPNEVYMCTRLAGKDSVFLPFNKGCNHGRGNPVNPDGHRTAYLWDEILTRESLANTIGQFACLTEEEDKNTGKLKRELVFPRYHQLDVVRGILADARQQGVGQTYLIQHSAGSGKSNSITWLAYQLVELFDTTGTANLFGSVVVVTDRRVLDRQIKDNIRLFSQVKNVVAHCESAQELRYNLEAGKKIIITTVQKFPFIADGIAEQADRSFAVIIDEAHSSQSGTAADSINQTLGMTCDEDVPEDLQDLILAAMASRRMCRNASYFAFTATPKPATLEKFGRQGADGRFYPFHLYAMKQAIEEGFILDVLANYTTYRSYYEIRKSVEDNPLFDTAKAQKKLRAYVEVSPRTIEAKARVMVDHFMGNVWQTRKLKGQARAMVVTRNIETAIRYLFAIRTALHEANVPFKALVAFSGEKRVDGVSYTEQSLNGIPLKDLKDAFRTDAYRFLVVANKYLTGFDEPLLHTMYVDKKLQGVLAVQALSRLNRSNVKLGKTDTFVLDFYNEPDDIKAAFDPFFTSAVLGGPTDVNVLHDLKDRLDDAGIYDQSEVVQFNGLYFGGAAGDALSPVLGAVVVRFDTDLDDVQRIDFKVRARQFVKIYAQLAAILPFSNAGWEMLHWFLKYLIPDLRVQDPEGDRLEALLDSVDLSTYGLERSHLNVQISLDAAETEVEPQNPNVRSGHVGEGETDPLDEIVRTFNERHFAGWQATPEEQRVKLVTIARRVMEHPDYQAQVADNPDPDSSRLALNPMIRKAIQDERKNELDLYRSFAQDPEFQQAFEASIFRLLSSGDMGRHLGRSGSG